MAAVTYSHTSLKFETLKMGDGSVWQVPWKLIPKTHFDTKLRSLRPAWFARHPTADVVYVYKARGV